jgi:hypothetical protein
MSATVHSHGLLPVRASNAHPRTIVITLLALLLAFAALGAVAPQYAAAQTGARFVETTATADFPDEIAFALTVEADSTIEEVELFWRPEHDVVLSAAYPDFQPGAHVELDHELDMRDNYLPPGLDIVYFWRVAERDGDITDSPEARVFYMDDEHDWDARTDDLVTVFWYAGGDGFSGDILESANHAAGRLSEQFGVVAGEPLRIVVYGDEGDFARALPPNSADWIGGQAYPGLNLIVAAIEPDSGEREIGRMVPHEVSHLILAQATENPWNSPPAWLDEGLAVYNQETEDERLPDVLDDAVDEGRLIPIRALNSSFPLDPDQALLSYAESMSVVTYIAGELGQQQLAALIAIFREGVSYDDAVERALGMTIDELDARWKAWLGYAGDRPAAENESPDRPASAQVEEDDDLSRNEAIFVLSLTGCGALLGLGMGVFALLKLRRMRR